MGDHRNSSTNSICRTDPLCLTSIVFIRIIARTNTVLTALKMQCVIQTATMKPA